MVVTTGTSSIPGAASSDQESTDPASLVSSGDVRHQDDILACDDCFQAPSLVCNGAAVDFETGIPADWTVVDNTGGTGIVWVTTADPACEKSNDTNGTGEAACADSDASGSPIPYDTELVSNPFDLTTWGAVVLDVKAYYNDINLGSNDQFQVDMWDGSTWTNELTWDEDHTPEDFTLNLSAYAGLSNVQVRFRYSGNGFDWYAQVDDIALTCVPTSPPNIEVDPAALTAVQTSGIISTQPMTITNSGGSSLNWDIVEDDSACDSPTDIPWLSLSTESGATFPLDSTVVEVKIDSTGITTGEYSANLCINSDDPGTPLVQLPVTLTVFTSLVCNGAPVDFEEGIPTDWAVVDNTGGTGIVWVTTADPDCEKLNVTNGSGEAACADSDASGSPAIPYDTELVSNPFDLTFWDTPVLEVKAYYRDITTDANDRFEVDVWDGSIWNNEISWDEDHEPEDISLSLSAHTGLPTVQVRFHYLGDGFDWFAQVDDITLTCIPIPVIKVDPLSLSSNQLPGQVKTQVLGISNNGTGTLTWDIVEDDNSCDSPTDIAWLSATPDMGDISPGSSMSVDVTTDATGLVPGLYTANLCVNSNDPVNPLVSLPVTMTVEAEAHRSYLPTVFK